MVKGLSAIALLVLLSGCVDAEQVDETQADNVAQNGASAAEQAMEPAAAAMRNARIAALDNQIRTMVGIPRADSLDQCRLAEVGKRACGGPEYYIAYSTQVTDEQAMQKLITEYTQLRVEHIQATQEMSTCEVIPRPQLTIENGICRATALSRM
ncbi:hypothetical protein EGC76_01530 [Pseudidiomarina gelatinasegens]|jgi:hypothetical protein|uniref:DUF1318 domain-containing protein n=1 Tax=Pseudidiomarina gelatinasegens TaxID=2487740 RepID=A0A443Z7L9_9GAMM|nr:hypothetical protein [Pseudidiomarina gelatinasegens]RWU12924.1 hypothetical protein EGC76_01530 [Pseudidiomarina gelatinasegens]|tara:strand:- start:610 stop:1071 length:462 start_codon:yes stop_codon:yes gene_type:complete